MAENLVQEEAKKRARRRLVGAVALAITAAIILPVVMEREPQPPASDLQIRIPSRDEEPVAPTPQDSATTSPSSSPSHPKPSEPSAEAVLPPEPEEDSVPPPEPSQAVENPAPAPKPPASTPKPTTSDNATSKPSGGGTAQTAPDATREQEAAKVRAILNGGQADVDKSTAAKAADDRQQYVVQLGAYRDSVNVKSLRAKLKAEGYNSFTEAVGDKTRVRAGPFTTQEQADKAAAKLKKIGLNGIVTTK